MEWLRSFQKKRRIRREVEQHLRETFDQSVEPLTEAERKQLNWLAVCWGAYCALAYVVIMASLIGLILLTEGAWPEIPLLDLAVGPPVIFFGVFFYKRYRYSERASAMWHELRQREFDLEVQRRMKTA